MNTPSQTPEPEKRLPVVDLSVGTDRYIYSDIFDRVVEGDEDLVGLVAYGLYQQRNRQWMADLQRDERRQPTNDELQAHAYGYRGHALRSLRGDAEAILFQFAESVIQSRMPRLVESAFNSRAVQELGELRSSIGRISGYRHHVIGHVIGFIVLVLLVWIATLITTYEPSVKELFGGGHAPAANSPSTGAKPGG